MIDYKSSGVDIDAGNEVVARIKNKVQSTFTKSVLTDLGSFAALYDLSELYQHYQQPVLVQSIDGLGTKVMVANWAKEYRYLGQDLLSATANDILVLGAKPLTLLDYIANDKLNPDIVSTIISGMADACKEQGVALVGGETAEMPGVYRDNEIDIAGVITGVVDKDKIINGSQIKTGDIIIGFSSNGLHTNGYSLARKLLIEKSGYNPDSYQDDLQMTVAEALLKPHVNYCQPILTLLQEQVTIHGMAHITGGGLLENIPRVLPKNCDAIIDKKSWPSVPLFSMLANLSQASENELYRTFNMGIGYVIILPESELTKLENTMKAFSAFSYYEIGHITTGEAKVRMK